MDNFLYAVFEIVVRFTILLFFLRFLVELAEVKKSDPYLQPLFILTKVVDVFASIFKPLAKGRFCTSAVVLIFLLRCLDIACNLVLLNLSYDAIQLLYVGTTSLILDFLNMATWVIIASAIASLLFLVADKPHPLVEVVFRLSDPIVDPFRKFSPNLGMIDIAPMFALLAIILLETVLNIITRNILPMIMTDKEALIQTAIMMGLI